MASARLLHLAAFSCESPFRFPSYRHELKNNFRSGYDTGTISGIKEMKDFLRTFGEPVPLTTNTSGYDISTSNESLVVSMLSAGTFFGQGQFYPSTLAY